MNSQPFPLPFMVPLIWATTFVPRPLPSKHFPDPNLPSTNSLSPQQPEKSSSEGFESGIAFSDFPLPLG